MDSLLRLYCGNALRAEQAFRKCARVTAPLAPYASRSINLSVGLHVSSLFPHYVDAQQSAMRGLNVGWYAIDQDGEIVSGPYGGRKECIVGITQFPNDAPALWSWP